MPITTDFEVARPDERDFYETDGRVVEHAFSIHNNLGRLHDEEIYSRELAQLCTDSGLRALREGRIRVEYDSFSKVYLVDMLVENGIPYELKTTSSLTTRHDSQLLNYLMLTGLEFGKLLNFRPASLGYRFITSVVETEDRFNCRIDDQEFVCLDQQSVWLREMIGLLLREWGAYLAVNLYSEALIHFAGGNDSVLTEVDVLSNGRLVGHEKMVLLNPETALEMTALRQGYDSYEVNLRRKLSSTPLKGIQWINMNGRHITLKTLAK